jgi:hypothetical protein
MRGRTGGRSHGIPSLSSTNLEPVFIPFLRPAREPFTAEFANRTSNLRVESQLRLLHSFTGSQS